MTTTREQKLDAALSAVLDQVDYTSGACALTEMVGACLPKEIIERARRALSAQPEPAVVQQPKPANG